MEKVKIEKLDNQGRGICYYNNKITFVPNTLPNEEVEIEIIKETKKYNEAKVINYNVTNTERIPSICPYFGQCGGCELMHSTYENTLKYKKEKLESIIYKFAHINTSIDIVPSDHPLNYRNKITLKVVNNKYGYYETSTHNLIEIDKCYLAEEPINNFIKDISKLHITNGEVVIRCNYNKELLIYIKSKEKVKPEIEYLKAKHKIVGIILNDKVLVGESSFVEIINHMLFTVSYDSFFQVNRNICSKLFNLIEQEINEDETILDLYCGVGTLGINATKKAKKAYGIEIVKNAVLNAITNSKINKRDNIYYMLGEVEKCLPKIQDTIDTIIIDPPRAGLDEVSIKTILNFKAPKIIYVSCDPITLSRDLKILGEIYNIKTIKGLDMFPYSHHIESFCVLERKQFMNYEIIEMNKENAIEYAKINTLSWYQSYQGIVAQSFLDKINTKEEIEKTKDNLIADLNDGSKRFLIKYNNKYVGLFRVRKTKYEGYEKYGELGALYLLDEAKHIGLGKVLFLEAIKELKNMNYKHMIVGCLENNPSNEFYKHMGLIFVKKNPIQIGNQELNENIYTMKI